MPTYEAPEQLQIIPTDSWVPGRKVAQADIDDLRLQGNTMWAGSGTPWLACGTSSPIGTGASAIVRSVSIPPQPGVRALKLAVIWPDNTSGETITLAVQDETGTLATQVLTSTAATGMAYLWTELGWARALDGEIKLILELSAGTVLATGSLPTQFDSGICILAIPFPAAAPVAFADEADGYIADTRTAADEGLSVRLANQLLTQAWNKWTSNKVFLSRVFFETSFTSRSTPRTVVASLPIQVRAGRTIGMTAYGTGLSTATVTLYVGGRTIELAGWGAVSTSVDGEFDEPSLPGNFIGNIVVASDGGSFDLHSISVYEVPL